MKLREFASVGFTTRYKKELEESERLRKEKSKGRNGHRSDSDEDDDVLSEDEATAFISELEGEDANIDDIADLSELIKKPLPGSIIDAFRDPKRRTKKFAEKLATDSLLPNLVPILFSDEIPMEMYVLFRIVMPHKKAVASAEKISEIATEHRVSTTAVLSEISGFDVKKRSDIKKIITKAINYHPHLATTLKGFVSKVTTLSKG